MPLLDVMHIQYRLDGCWYVRDLHHVERDHHSGTVWIVDAWNNSTVDASSSHYDCQSNSLFSALASALIFYIFAAAAICGTVHGYVRGRCFELDEDV